MIRFCREPLKSQLVVCRGVQVEEAYQLRVCRAQDVFPQEAHLEASEQLTERAASFP